MASDATVSMNGSKQGMPINAKNSKQGISHNNETNAGIEGEHNFDSTVNISSSTRSGMSSKKASAFEIIAVEMQPDSDSSAENANAHTDTDQEQDLNGTNAISREESLAPDSENGNVGDFSSAADSQLTGLNGGHHMTAADVVIDYAAAVQNGLGSQSNSDSQRNNININNISPPQQNQNYASDPSVSQASSSTVPVAPSSAMPSNSNVAPAPSVSTIKTQTGREITILKVEAEFRRGRWACSDYHDHRDTSPPPPNPSPANDMAGTTGSASTQQITQSSKMISQQQLPGVTEQNRQMLSLPQQGQPPVNTNYSSTQQMVEKTAAALSRVLSTDPSSYPNANGSGFAAFSSGQVGNMGTVAPAMVQSNGASGTVASGQSSGFLAPGQAQPGASGVTSLGAIELKVAQALDLVKKYLMAAVRHELEAMQGQVATLQTRLDMVQQENELLRAHVSEEVLQSLTLLPDSSATAPLVHPSSNVENSLPTVPSSSPSAVSSSPQNSVTSVRQHQTQSSQYYSQSFDQSPMETPTNDRSSSGGDAFVEETSVKRKADISENL